MLVLGATTPMELDRRMDLDIEIERRDHLEPVHAPSTLADSLPGPGIGAAALGVVIVT